MKHKIKVTQSHIDDSDEGNSGTCPIALAMEDIGFREPSVTGTEAWFYDHGRCRIMKLPIVAKKFVYAFDNFDEVEPFEFEANSYPRDGGDETQD